MSLTPRSTQDAIKGSKTGARQVQSVKSIESSLIMLTWQTALFRTVRGMPSSQSS